MHRRRRSAVTLSLLALTFASVGAACSSSNGSDPETSGPAKQAVERLRDFGLTNDEATCIVDEVGSASVVEATDLNAYTDGQQYQDAAEACIDDA